MFKKDPLESFISHHCYLKFTSSWYKVMDKIEEVHEEQSESLDEYKNANIAPVELKNVDSS
jgi:hypothetical protein